MAAVWLMGMSRVWVERMGLLLGRLRSGRDDDDDNNEDDDDDEDPRMVGDSGWIDSVSGAKARQFSNSSGAQMLMPTWAYSLRVRTSNLTTNSAATLSVRLEGALQQVVTACERIISSSVSRNEGLQ